MESTQPTQNLTSTDLKKVDQLKIDLEKVEKEIEVFTETSNAEETKLKEKNRKFFNQ